MLAVVTIGEWRGGDAGPVVVAWAVATAIASGLAAWAFRIEAERAFGPPGSPERQRRRLTGVQLARSFGAGVLVTAAFGLLLHFVSQVDDSGPSGEGLVFFIVYFSLLYGTAFAWNVWAAIDEDADEADRVPARSVPQPVAAPPRDRRADLRRAFVVCLLLVVVGGLAAIEGFADGDAARAGIGLGLAAGSGALLVWVATQEDGPGH